MERIRSHSAGRGVTPPPAFERQGLWRAAVAACLALELIAALSFGSFGGSTIAIASIQRAKSLIRPLGLRDPWPRWGRKGLGDEAV